MSVGGEGGTAQIIGNRWLNKVSLRPRGVLFVRSESLGLFLTCQVGQRGEEDDGQEDEDDGHELPGAPTHGRQVLLLVPVLKGNILFELILFH